MSENKVQVFDNVTGSDELFRRLSREHVLGFDTEFGNEGGPNILSLLQFSEENGNTSLIDVYRCPKILESQNLKHVLESASVVKVIHDVKQDSKLLHFKGIQITCVEDTQLLHKVKNAQLYRKPVNVCQVLKLGDLCEQYKIEKPIEKPEYMWKYCLDRTNGIPKNVTLSAASDAACMIPLYNAMNRDGTQLEPFYEDLYKELLHISIWGLISGKGKKAAKKRLKRKERTYLESINH